jgi:F-type H+-transporting ATPase subunit b
MNKRRSASLLAATFAVLAVRTAAFASENAHGGEGGHGPDSAAWLTLGFAFFNFTLFVLLLLKYAWPAVRDFLASRHQEVAEAMAAAEEARKETEAIRAEFAQKEAALEETRRRMIEEIRQGAAADREKALREARAAAERLRADAERQAEHDLARARRELRAEAARLAADLAEKEVRVRITDADRSRLVREFVEGVARQ